MADPSRPPIPRHADWRERAACSGAEVRVFFPDSGTRADVAKQWCAACPVRTACLEHALTTGERWGVWGGATEDERRAIRRQRRKAAA